MELKLSKADTTFRDEMRAELAALLPADIRDRQRRITTQAPPVADQRRWFALLNGRGWSVPRWPVELGGTDWTPIQQFLFEDEIHRLDGPEFNWLGTHMVGPVIYTFGSEAQKERFLAPTRNGDIIWCQGFSEPSAGSDLASLRTQARRDGDRYIVSGQKIWTSGAHEADWGFFLVRTDPTAKPQAGISFLLIDMKSPGVTVRPIPQINGETHLCEVFLDEVEVPADNLVGDPGRGWTYAKFLLEHERTSSAFIFWSRRELRRARMMADAIRGPQGRLADVPGFADRLTALEADLIGLEWSVLRVLAGETGRYPASVAPSILKISGSLLQQAITELHVDLLGLRATRFFQPGTFSHAADADWPDYVPGRTSIMMISRATTIYGGSMQIQKNILAKTALGL